MREHRDDPQEPSLNIGENYSRAERLMGSSWLLMMTFLYMPVGLYLVFVARPLRTFFGLPANAEWMLLELILWVGMPLVGAIILHYRRTESKKIVDLDAGNRSIR